ncbi:MAG: beta-lactamase family protein [Clostridia bacterium]|nr:beta-lactamase family protein [Clostridia bacterium]
MQELKDRLSAFAKGETERAECFGGAACVFRDGEEVTEIFGDERFNEKSIYRLASVTKIFTAAAVMKLYGENKIDVQAPLSRYINGFERVPLGALSPDGRVYSVGMPHREITLFDLLTHTAGLGADELGTREYSLVPIEEKTSLGQICDYYAKNFHLAFEPGTKSAYSGFAGYDCLARVVEVVSRKCFNDYLRTSFFEPLGMTDTTFQPTDEQYARIVPMHKRISGEDKEIDFRGALFRGIPRTYEAAGAALISSLSDMLRFLKMLLCGGEGIITPECVKMMLSPALPDSLLGLAKGESNCFGCFCVTGAHRLKKGTVFCHGAYGTHIILRPYENFAAVLLKNSLTGMSETPKSVTEFEKAVILP